MGLTYFKRHRMEICLLAPRPEPRLPEGYRFVPWSEALLADHAEVKYHSFRGELDATLFECLSTFDGCVDLMQEIAARPGFCPAATWLIEYVELPHKREFCGCVQGVQTAPQYGAIQNVGVTPFHRGRGLGRKLIEASLWGFKSAGIPRRTWKSPPKTAPPCASTTGWASAARRRCIRRWIWRIVKGTHGVQANGRTRPDS